eukprot:TRINITY_DN779_c0_g1_i4.p1 TRINITY_DN779_c0_g1~~TRINITY_DN779_c0_g1_i4.p1  ORF type:complete len:153 (-),score=28.49 TRINITY_DN779_c0_g1_i4:75-533(-)
MKIFSLLLLCAACKTHALSSQVKQGIPGEYLNQGRNDGKARNNKPFPRKRLDDMLLAMNAVVETEENTEALEELKAEGAALTGEEATEWKQNTAHKALCAMFRDCMETFGYQCGGYIKVMEKADWYSQMPGEEGKILKKHYYKLTQALLGLV